MNIQIERDRLMGMASLCLNKLQRLRNETLEELVVAHMKAANRRRARWLSRVVFRTKALTEDELKESRAYENMVVYADGIYSHQYDIAAKLLFAANFCSEDIILVDVVEFQQIAVATYDPVVSAIKWLKDRNKEKEEERKNADAE